MSNTAELCARLLEHAAIHDRETSPYSPEQAAWAADLRDAAALIQAAPVVERADSATPVVERGAGNVSDNAATVAPARWYCVTNYGGATLCTGRDDAAEVAAEQDIAVPPHGPHRAVMLAEVRPARVPLTDEQAESLIENSDGRWHDGEFRIDGPDLMKLLRDAAQPAPARVPLTGAEIASMQRSANTTGVQFLQPSTVRWIVRAIEAAHGITAQGEPK